MARNEKEPLDVFSLCFSGEITLPGLILLDLNMTVVEGFLSIHSCSRKTSIPLQIKDAPHYHHIIDELFGNRTSEKNSC